MAEDLKKIKKKKNKFKKGADQANSNELKPKKKEFTVSPNPGSSGKKHKADGLNQPLVKHREAILEEIFLNHFLPSNRKLVPFSGRPLKRIGEICSNSKDGRKRLLVLWRFEHKLKLVYERFLRAVEGLASLVVEDLSKRALRTALNLLAERPEGERFLLSMLVNKMGHPKAHIGAFVATLLEDLTKRQPKMRSVVVAEVERLIYRTNVSPKAHVYASTFLSQILLHAEDSSLAVQLLSIYFGLFKTLVNRKLPDNRLIGILLSAANRALPFAKEKADSLVEDINTLYKIVHTSSYSVSLQTLKLLFQVHQIRYPSNYDLS
ncbi:hypothetical protein OSTOST_23352 [Ostertagia ostertagi]